MADGHIYDLDIFEDDDRVKDFKSYEGGEKVVLKKTKKNKHKKWGLTLPKKSSIKFTGKKAGMKKKGTLRRALESEPETMTMKALVLRVTDSVGTSIVDDAATLSVRTFGGEVGGEEDLINTAKLLKDCSYGKVEIVKATGPQVVDGVLEVTVDIEAQVSVWSDINSESLAAATLILGELTSQYDRVLTVMPGTNTAWRAWALVKGHWSCYNKHHGSAPTAVMHELGHNFGFGHSASLTFYGGDTSGFMGLTSADHEDYQKCYNTVYSYYSGWYTDKFITVKVDELPYSGKLIGLMDYKKAPEGYIGVIIPQPDTEDDLDDVIIGYHRTRAGALISEMDGLYKNSVSIYTHRASTESFSASTNQANLGEHDSHLIENFNGSGNKLEIRTTTVDYEEDIDVLYFNIEVGFDLPPQEIPVKVKNVVKLLSQMICLNPIWLSEDDNNADECADRVISSPSCKGDLFVWVFKSWGCRCCPPLAQGEPWESNFKYNQYWNVYQAREIPGETTCFEDCAID
eukprot:Selendium_serpulae@DN5259_c0_g1_i11.p1